MSGSSHVYELIIIGAGPAGITAAIYAARKRTDFIVLTTNVGGQVTYASEVENYTAFNILQAKN